MLGAQTAWSQISASAAGQTTTAYATGPQDPVYLFCSQQGSSLCALTARYSTGAAATFDWQKYNTATGSFDAFQSDNSGAESSQITGLADGAYRVSVTSSGNSEVYTAWVFNSWYDASASIAESTCAYLQLEGAFTQADLTYVDLTSGSPLQVLKTVQVKWESGSDLLSSLLSPRFDSPPSENTTYKMTVYDQFGCSAEASVYYESIVPTADFTASPMDGEAPLEVSFSNQSVNADEYEWFFFRELSAIQEEAAAQGSVSDSIMDTALNESLVYTYENSGKYMVKLVATKNSSATSCRDTVYLDDYIVADTSFVDVPNVFTPNGDGDNDNFVVKYTSMRSLNIKIFNRWGKEVFSVNKNNLGTYADSGMEIAWDGKINGRYASPGVYYYVIEGRGRDDRKRKKQGFVHLFREK